MQDEPILFQAEQLATEKFVPRPYQTGAINASVNFFRSKVSWNGIVILPTGSGKSVVIANIAKELTDGNTLVLQPSLEILQQNYAKFISYGYRASIYSASAGSYKIGKVTFATIGSIIGKKHLFRDFKYIIIDECHLVNSQTKERENEEGEKEKVGGMYNEFIKAHPHCKVLGLTATPYRLTTTFDGAMLKFLTRTSPRIFSKVLYVVQNSVLFKSGFLAKLKYYAFDVVDRKMLSLNSTGTDFSQKSLQAYYRKIDFPKVTAYWAGRILPKRKNLLIFCTLISEAEQASRLIPGSVVITGKTEKKKRAQILADFKSGKIKCLLNVGVLTTGFDFPGLEAVMLSRSTMSLALYYQMIGRGMRIAEGKEDCWIIDLGGNYKLFGKIETMQVVEDGTGKYSIMNNGRHLTNVPFQKAA